MCWYVHPDAVLIHNTLFTFFLIQPDFNECIQNPEICGFGTCNNNDNGTFYECTCEDGAMITGTNSDGTLTCVGKEKCFCSLYMYTCIYMQVTSRTNATC